MLAMRESNSFHATNLDPNKVRLQEMLGCDVVRTAAMVMCLFLVILYNPGYWSFKAFAPSHVSSQNLTCDPLLILKVPKRRKSCFTFISLDQKCESPGFHSTYASGLDLRYLFLSNCCHFPSVVRSLNNHLLSRALFFTLRSMMPKPPWSLG